MQAYKIVAKVTHSFAWPKQSPGSTHHSFHENPLDGTPSTADIGMAILHLWVLPNSIRTDSGLGTGFILHPWVHPPPEFWPTILAQQQQPLCCQLVIRI
jgi:hypothetical protein